MNLAAHLFGVAFGVAVCIAMYLGRDAVKGADHRLLGSRFLFYSGTLFLVSIPGYAAGLYTAPIAYSWFLGAEYSLEFSVVQSHIDLPKCSDGIELENGKRVCRASSKGLSADVGDLIVVSGKGSSLGVFAETFSVETQ